MSREAPAVRKAPSTEDVDAPALRKAPSKEAVEAAEPDEEMAPAPKGPARGGPARGAAPKAKAKAKGKKAAAAPPARGAAVPVMKAIGKAKAKGKAKAVAAKSFASVAAKAKSSGGKSAPGAGTWYFMSDLRKMKVGADDSKAWTKYDAKMTKALEDAYSKGFKQYTMKHGDKTYIVKFKTMMQFRADDKYLQRPVKRE
mmetsp:Transcript_64445/g.145421  ORF Transcript_64445/g.145421 Transcript_64445/m.145421 type:complete len:199 (+) Transcript_64445:77-673(+)|eukprot:CAMPEP_0197873210 /NCGR_PEP_ID=MMETSP1439-20131203/3075_1 /TAXON_ID=66791 /ORGANISM="Gonyaulax spinifera, Strain CCMP409" /LENGTH=198 /DNA_ID=CAMNT_0043492249 /DNA_START=72 /DNA_END=668 /DNA_ORIENTATION=+